MFGTCANLLQWPDTEMKGAGLGRFKGRVSLSLKNPYLPFFPPPTPLSSCQPLLIFHLVFPTPSPCFPSLCPSFTPATGSLSCLFLFSAAVSAMGQFQVNWLNSTTGYEALPHARPLPSHTAARWGGVYCVNTTGMTLRGNHAKSSDCCSCLVLLILWVLKHIFPHTCVHNSPFYSISNTTNHINQKLCCFVFSLFQLSPLQFG